MSIVFPVDPTARNKQLKLEERQAVTEFLLKENKEGKLEHGSLKQAAILFNKSRRTILRIWKRCKSSVDHGIRLDVSSKLVGRVGRKRMEVDINQVKETPLCRRTNIRSLAFGMNMAKSTVFRRIKDGTIWTHTNSIKPQLTEQNKKVRLQFCLLMLDQSTIHTNRRFMNMFNYVHMKNVFSLSKKSERYYLLPEEHDPNPYRSCKSKNFIPKVMFMAAVARPRFDENGIKLFSGNIGIFPFVVNEPTKRNSKNRTAGTLKTKPILSVTKDITTCLIEQVLPSIRSKWPASDSNILVFIQKDNARPQSCMIEVMKDNGGNNYKVPHLNKNEQEREDNLPLQLCCDIDIVDQAFALLQQ